MALALLASDWCKAHGGALTALIVDHGLRAESAAEARHVSAWLAALGIAARVLVLPRFSGGAAPARQLRYAALAMACRDAGITDLLLGHHAADQAETLVMRSLAGSGAAGFAGMAAVRYSYDVRLLRPLLVFQPHALRALLRDAGQAWIEDPSNADRRALRARVRGISAEGAAGLAAAAARAGAARDAASREAAGWIAANASVRPEGFVILPDGSVPAEVLGMVLQGLAGAEYAPPREAVASFAARLRRATLAGVRVMPWRLGGWLLARERAAMTAPVEARAGAVWDGRFRVVGVSGEDMTVGALSGAAARFRKQSDLPAAVLQTLPALWQGGTLAGVPHLGYWPGAARGALVFAPPVPLAGNVFRPGNLSGRNLSGH